MQLEHQRQAATQVTVGNIITSMRLLSTLDWQEFFESVSLIEPISEKDPAEVYTKMHFATRDRYRNIIERIGKRSNAGELMIAERLIELAEKAKTSRSSDERETHIGFYLLDDGIAALEREFNYRPLFTERFKCFIESHPATVYLGSILFLTLLFVGGLTAAASHFGAGVPLIIGFAIVSALPSFSINHFLQTFAA